MRLSAFLLCFALYLHSQELPDASTLIKESAESSKKRKSYQYSTEMNVEMTVAGNPVKMTMTWEIAGVNPDRMRIESQSSIGGGATIVSDGEFTYTYIAQLKQYTKKAALSGPQTILSNVGLDSIPEMSKLVQSSKVLREESIEVDGAKRACWVLETKLDKIPIPAPPGAELAGAVITLWVDKELRMSVRMTMSGKMQAGPMTTDMKQDMRMRSIKVDPKLPDSLFTFVPPEGAKEVPEFAAPGMKKPDMAGKPSPAFALKSLDGKALASDALKGKTILLDFWTTWCGPCRKEMPVLEKLHQEFKDAGLVIIGVNVGEDRQLVDKFLKSATASYPIALSNDTDIVPDFQVSAFPTYVVIAPDGNVAAYQIGSNGEESIRALLVKAGLKSPEK